MIKFTGSVLLICLLSGIAAAGVFDGKPDETKEQYQASCKEISDKGSAGAVAYSAFIKGNEDVAGERVQFDVKVVGMNKRKPYKKTEIEGRIPGHDDDILIEFYGPVVDIEVGDTVRIFGERDPDTIRKVPRGKFWTPLVLARYIKKQKIHSH